MPELSLAELLRLDSPPIGISFIDAAPPGVPHVSTTEPAGCGYWRRAATGEMFYTVADDHKRCPVGAHTHNVQLSPAEELQRQRLLHADVTGAGHIRSPPANGLSATHTKSFAGVGMP